MIGLAWIGLAVLEFIVFIILMKVNADLTNDSITLEEVLLLTVGCLTVVLFPILIIWAWLESAVERVLR